MPAIGMRDPVVAIDDFLLMPPVVLLVILGLETFQDRLASDIRENLIG